MLLATVLLAFRGDEIECVRDGAGGSCHTPRGTFALADIAGLELETREGTESISEYSSAQQSVVLARLVLVTRSARIPLETTFSSYPLDGREVLVYRFNAFIRSDAKEFPAPGSHWLYDVATAALALVGTWFIVSSFRRRARVRIDVDETSGTLVITRRMAPSGKTEIQRLPFAPPPRVSFSFDGSPLLCLMQDVVITPLIDVPSNLRDKWVERVETVLRP